jgi:hypothetical protein
MRKLYNTGTPRGLADLRDLVFMLLRALWTVVMVGMNKLTSYGVQHEIGESLSAAA